jgi:hypothetical protein
MRFEGPITTAQQGRRGGTYQSVLLPSEWKWLKQQESEGSERKHEGHV